MNIVKRYFIILLLCTSWVFPAGYTRAETVMEWIECVKEAKDNNPNLTSAAEKVKQEKAAKEITRSALLTQITGTASEETSKSPSSSSSGATVATTSTSKAPTTYDYGLDGSQLLFDGFKTSYNLSGAERNIIAARYNYDVTSSNVRLNLRSAFVDLLSSQELLNVTQQIEARRKQNLELVKLRYEGGREHKGSLMTAEADLAQASFDVRQAARAIYISQRNLTKQLGRKLFSPMSAKGELKVDDSSAIMPDFENIAETTPLLQQLIAKKESAKFGLKSAYADFFPQVYATASIGNTNTDAFPDKNQWSVGTSLTFPFFDGGNRIAAVSKAKAVLGQANEDERSGRDGVIFTLSDTWVKLKNAIENVTVKRKYLEATEVRSRIAEAEYSLGLMSFDNWIIIEDNLVSGKKTLVSAQQAALTAEANWIQAKGGTLDYDKK